MYIYIKIILIHHIINFKFSLCINKINFCKIKKIIVPFFFSTEFFFKSDENAF